jgi:outer membrane protein OmpA-like peptidoglycan-associated protein
MKSLLNTFFACSVASISFAQQVTEKQAAEADKTTINPAEVTTTEKDESRRLYLAAGVGMMIMDASAANEPVYFSARLGYDLTDHVSLEGGMLYSPSVSEQGGTTSYSMGGVTADVLLHLLDKQYKFDPYLTAGAAFLFSNGEVLADQDSYGFVAPRLGVGLAYHINDNLSIRAEGKTGLQPSATHMDEGMVTTAELGMLYRFGGSEKVAEPTEAPTYNQKLQDDFKGVVKDATPEGAKDVMILEVYINFDYDQTVIKPDYYPALNEIARVIKKATAKNPNVTVSVEGHADRRVKSVAAYNQKLSERRADVVKGYLVSTGCEGTKMSTVGYGFNRPKVPHDLINGTPENRRVDVFIHGVGDEASRNELRMK